MSPVADVRALLMTSCTRRLGRGLLEVFAKEFQDQAPEYYEKVRVVLRVCSQCAAQRNVRRSEGVSVQRHLGVYILNQV